MTEAFHQKEENHFPKSTVCGEWAEQNGDTTQVKSKRKRTRRHHHRPKLTLTHPAGSRRSETNMGGVEDVSIDLVLHNPNPQASNGVLKLDTWRDGGGASGSVTLWRPTATPCAWIPSPARSPEHGAWTMRERAPGGARRPTHPHLA